MIGLELLVAGGQASAVEIFAILVLLGFGDREGAFLGVAFLGVLGLGVGLGLGGATTVLGSTVLGVCRSTGETAPKSSCAHHSFLALSLSSPPRMVLTTRMRSAQFCWSRSCIVSGSMPTGPAHITPWFG